MKEGDQSTYLYMAPMSIGEKGGEKELFTITLAQ